MVESRTPDAVVVLPGIMGSELVDASNDVVWGMKPKVLFRQLLSGDVLKRLSLPPGAPDDGVRPSRLIAFPVYLPLLDGVEPYTALVKALRQVTLHPDAVLEFPYDWRRSVAHNAALLERDAMAHLTAWRERARSFPGDEEPKLSLVCHSMGGLVARHFTEVLGHRDVTRRVVTLGTPFAGSVKAVRLLAHGDVLPLGLLAGAVRDAARTFPGVYDLLPSFPCLHGSSPELEHLSGDALVDLGADRDLVDEAAARHRTVISDAQAAGAGICSIRPMVGVSQPTLASVRLDHGEAIFDERLQGDERRGGDSTVGRDHAYASLSTPAYLPQKHGKLASMKEAITSVTSILTEVELGVYQGEGRGMRLPDAATARRPFEVEVEPGEPGHSGLSTVRLLDAESGRQVDEQTTTRREGRWRATFTAPDPGIYRVTSDGGGFSPTEEQLIVLPRS